MAKKILSTVREQYASPCSPGPSRSPYCHEPAVLKRSKSVECTCRDRQLEYESWGFIEVNFRRKQDCRGRNLQIEYAKCGVQIEYDST